MSERTVSTLFIRGCEHPDCEKPAAVVICDKIALVHKGNGYIASQTGFACDDHVQEVNDVVMSKTPPHAEVMLASIVEAHANRITP